MIEAPGANGEAVDAQPPVRRNGDDEEEDFRPRRFYYQQNGGGRGDRSRAPSHSWVASLTIIAVVSATFVSGAAIFKLFIEPLERRLDDHANNALERHDQHVKIALGYRVDLVRDSEGLELDIEKLKEELVRELEGIENNIKELEEEVLGETRALWLAAARRAQIDELARRIVILESANQRRFDPDIGN